MALTEQASPIKQGLIHLESSEDEGKEKGKDEDEENENLNGNDEIPKNDKVKENLKVFVIRGDFINKFENAETDNLRGNGAFKNAHNIKPKKAIKPIKIKLKIAQNKIRGKKDEKIPNLLSPNVPMKSKAELYVCLKPSSNTNINPKKVKISTDSTGKKLFKCPICHLVYPWRRRMDVHLRYHDIKGAICGDCGLLTKSLNDLTRHNIRKHSSIRPFICPKCKANFKTKQHLVRHLQGHNNKPNFKCDICNIFFHRKDSLKVHLRSKNHFAVVKSQNLSKTAANKRQKQKKEKVVLKKTNGSNKHKSKRDITNPFICPICNSELQNKITLQLHIRYVHGPRNHVCTICSKGFPHNFGLKRHKDSVHQSNKDAKNGKCILKNKKSQPTKLIERIQCSICHAKLANSYILKRHIQRLHTHKFKSQLMENRLERVKSRIQKTISSTNELKFIRVKITQTNNGSLFFHCSTCPQKYSNKDELELHFHKHKVNRFVCELCGYTFSQRGYRNKHKSRFHYKDEKPLVESIISIEDTVEAEKGNEDVTNNNYAKKTVVEKSDVTKFYNVASTSALQQDFDDVDVDTKSGVEDVIKQMVLSPIKTNIPNITALIVNPVFEPNQKENLSIQHRTQFKPQIDLNVRVKLDKISSNHKGIVTWPPDLEGRTVNHNAALENLKDWEQRGQKRKRSVNPKKGQETYKTQFNVETIEKMEFDVSERVHLFYVKWEGYHHECNTWEPLEHLEGAEDIVSSFLNQRFNEATLRDLAEKVALNIDEVSDELMISSLPTTSGQRNLSEVPTKFVAQRRLLKFLDRNIHSSYVRLVQDCKKALLTYLLVLKREKQTTRLTKWEHIINKMDKSEAFITVENNVDLEPPPENFCYINDYVPTGNIVVLNTPDTYCLCTDCGPGIKSCCGKQEHNAFTYTKSFKMNVNPGNAIFECNKLCKCGPSCRNRVVQHGRKVPLCIFRTDNGRGWGVKVLRKIACGEFVCEYVGEIIDHEEAEKRGKAYDAEGRTYLFDLDYNSRDNLYTVDAAKYGNISHFINHSCEPNLGVYATWINCQDPNLPKLALFALREVQKGEELTFDYMMNIDEPIVKPKTPEKTGGRQKLDTPEKGALSSLSDRPTCKCSADSCRVDASGRKRL